jgi:hypothetical protein
MDSVDEEFDSVAFDKAFRYASWCPVSLVVSIEADLPHIISLIYAPAVRRHSFYFAPVILRADDLRSAVSRHGSR